jgi:hypothetical protein
VTSSPLLKRLANGIDKHDRHGIEEALVRKVPLPEQGRGRAGQTAQNASAR